MFCLNTYLNESNLHTHYAIFQAEGQEDDEPDMWEETFKSFHDSKPNGLYQIVLYIIYMMPQQYSAQLYKAHQKQLKLEIVKHSIQLGE